MVAIFLLIVVIQMLVTVALVAEQLTLDHWLEQEYRDRATTAALETLADTAAVAVAALVQ
jgi:hypothetical protein